MENLVCWYPITLLRAEQMTIFTSNSLPEAAVSHTFPVPRRSHRYWDHWRACSTNTKIYENWQNINIHPKVTVLVTSTTLI